MRDSPCIIGMIGFFAKVCQTFGPISLPLSILADSVRPLSDSEERSMNLLRKRLMLAGLLALPVFLSGCNPFGMGFFTPIPMQPWVADRIEERIVNKNDHRTPILPAIPPGFRPFCEDPPD